jgi:hypothetical protein
VAGAAQPLRVEVLRAGTKGLGHLGAAEIALASVAPARGFATLQALHGGLQSIFAPAGNQLLDQRLKPVRCALHEIAVDFPRAIENFVAGAQQRKAPVSGGFRLGEGEEGLGE